MKTLNYPIGKQSFADIRRGDYVYVDKTAYIPLLLKNGTYKFLSRPRRFGKSLLISTLEAFFQGKRELFKGLAIDSLKPEPWEEHVVLHFDFSGRNYQSADDLSDSLSDILSRIENAMGLSAISKDPSGRLDQIVRSAFERSGRGVVILIDEYDNPITSAIGKPELQDEIRNILYSFYASLKSLDPFIRFCMLTGVTKYGKMSVFSGLNNLHDISFNEEFAAICGVTEDELHSNFNPGVERLAEKSGVSTEEAYRQLKLNYDGYHFSEEMLDVYNPYSIINALSTSKIRNYWFGTGTPTLLVKVLEREDFDVRQLNGSEASFDQLSNISALSVDPKALFYQTGYLTIKDYDPEFDSFTLGFPNREVESGFMDNLLQIYTHNESSSVIRNMTRDLRNGKAKEFVERLASYLAGIPYDLRKNAGRYENYYHTIFYAIFSLLGTDVNAEYHTSQGSIDLLIRTAGYIYILELKINGTAQNAIGQIHENGYSSPFMSDGRKIILIGLGFSKRTNTIESSEIERLN